MNSRYQEFELEISRIELEMLRIELEISRIQTRYIKNSKKRYPIFNFLYSNCLILKVFPGLAPWAPTRPSLYPKRWDCRFTLVVYLRWTGLTPLLLDRPLAGNLSWCFSKFFWCSCVNLQRVCCFSYIFYTAAYSCSSIFYRGQSTCTVSIICSEI